MKKLFLFTLFFLLSAGPVQAQSLSLGIWPPLLEVMIQPGKSITQVYKISNPGESDVVLTSSVVPFFPADEAGNVKLDTSKVSADPTLEVSVNSWFSFQNADLQLGQDFVLKAGKEQEVVLRIAVPAEATEADYYYSLVFQTTPTEALRQAQGGGGSTTQVKIGAHILLAVSRTGNPPLLAKIKEFAIRNSQFVIGKLVLIDSFDKPEFLLRLQNTGQSFFKPLGTITVNGWFRQKFVLELLPENVLNNSTRQIGCQKDNNPQLCVLSSKFLLGRYTARAELGLDEAGAKYQKEIIFWAIPIKLILGVLVAIIVTFLIIKAKLDKLSKL